MRDNLTNLPAMANEWKYKDLLTCFNFDDIKDMDREQAEEYITDRIYEEEIVYYGSAMEYLTKHDDGLQESLGLASDMGYELDHLDSTILATLLYQQELKEQLEYFLDDYFMEEEEGDE